MKERTVEISEDQLMLLQGIWEHASDMLMCEKSPKFGEEFGISFESEKKKLADLVRQYEEKYPREYPF